jgi:hypothetical protein
MSGILNHEETPCFGGKFDKTLPNKSVRENTKERIEEILGKFRKYVKAFTPESYEGTLSDKEATDQILGLIHEETFDKIMQAKKSGYDEASALSTTLKPSWTSEELDRVLPKLDRSKIEFESTHHQGIEQVAYIRGWRDYEKACKQALLGRYI